MEEVILVNKMENAVKQMAEQMMLDSNVCKCSRCLLDVLAMALNTLPPKYVVTNIGNAVTSVDLDSSQWKANVTMAICNAINIVKGRPRHS
ncbi:MAG: late competence development ComFB family protein [Candidatus Riflebacteria bacterium]|nr:late competence development ComFB family protein [Candidatus Riflebacteria bacterium]